MGTIWLTSVGISSDQGWSEDYVRWFCNWPSEARFPPKDSRDNIMQPWRPLRRPPHREDHLIVLVGPPSPSDPLHFDRHTYISLSELLSLHRANRTHLIVIARNLRSDVPRNPEADVWQQRCQPLLEELLTLRHPDSEVVCRDLSRGVNGWASIEKLLTMGEKSLAREIREGPATLFLSYSHRDEDLRDGLSTHLKLLERTGLIQTWYDRRILRGTSGQMR